MSKPHKQKSKSAKKGFMPKQEHETASNANLKSEKNIVPEQISQQIN
jgi:hypothetical protein